MATKTYQKPEPVVTPAQRVQAVVEPWLLDPNGDLGKLPRWLQGYDLPVSCDGDEPYVLVMRGIPEGSRELRDVMAERIAAVLEKQPDVKNLQRRPENFLYNTLRLASHFPYPAIVEQLSAMKERGKLKGKYMFELTEVLEDAISVTSNGKGAF